ncbi:hypothetical protein BRADI_2g36310v3 [Brachypodium distachyon]|uniref:Uncharacterized protein n=1 Tax=Brachypodium distachyon TaxID=15368 RepID=I1HLZ2_BRADI|nr:hypothetical protein BRADI_2g36310v3 [Brachypodium distachyon]
MENLPMYSRTGGYQVFQDANQLARRPVQPQEALEFLKVPIGKLREDLWLVEDMRITTEEALLKIQKLKEIKFGSNYGNSRFPQKLELFGGESFMVLSQFAKNCIEGILKSKVKIPQACRWVHDSVADLIASSRCARVLRCRSRPAGNAHKKASTRCRISSFNVLNKIVMLVLINEAFG